MRIFVLFLLVFAFLSMALWAGDVPTPEQKRDAVNLVRTLNTAEVNYRVKIGKYGTLTELVESGLVTLNDPAQPLPGFKVRLIVSADADNYQMSVIQDVAKNRWALFSDEQGVIYTAEPLR